VRSLGTWATSWRRGGFIYSGHAGACGRNGDDVMEVCRCRRPGARVWPPAGSWPRRGVKRRVTRACISSAGLDFQAPFVRGCTYRDSKFGMPGRRRSRWPGATCGVAVGRNVAATIFMAASLNAAGLLRCVAHLCNGFGGLFCQRSNG